LPPNCHDSLLLAGGKSGGIAVWDTPLAALGGNREAFAKDAAPKAVLQPPPSSAQASPTASPTAFVVAVAAGGGGVCAGGGDDGAVSVFDLGAQAMTARFQDANVSDVRVAVGGMFVLRTPQKIEAQSSGGLRSRERGMGVRRFVSLRDPRKKLPVATLTGHK
jgi:hypothetical protein